MSCRRCCPSAFPLGGRLADLITYLQWSWPQDGSRPITGYDVSVEFNESYVHALYLAFGYGAVSPPSATSSCSVPVALALCRHRNNIVIRACVVRACVNSPTKRRAGVRNLQYPSAIAGDTPLSPQVIGSAGQLAVRLRLADGTVGTVA